MNSQEIQKLKKETENEILEIYPISKQLDIIAKIGSYNDNDFTKMKKFVENKITKYELKKNEL